MVSNFAVPNLLPGAIANGPDGNVWFTSGDQIGEVTPTGQFTFFSNGTTGLGTAITTGSDGNLWYTVSEGSLSFVGRMTPTGQVTLFSRPGVAISDGIVTGPDGALWVTGSSLTSQHCGVVPLNRALCGVIIRITPSGSMTIFTDPKHTMTSLDQIAVGPDGALWFAEGFPTRWLGRMTTSGQVTAYSPAGLSLQNGVAAGRYPIADPPAMRALLAVG